MTKLDDGGKVLDRLASLEIGGRVGEGGWGLGGDAGGGIAKGGRICCDQSEKVGTCPWVIRCPERGVWECEWPSRRTGGCWRLVTCPSIT